MADPIKISSLPSADALDGTEEFPLVQGSTTKKGLISQIATFIGSAFAPTNNPTFTGTVTTPAIVVSGETANTIASFDTSKNVKSLSTGTYPSLTELSYVKGVTSAVQTQLNGKQASITDVIWGAILAAFTAKTTPVDADIIGLGDSADSGKAKKVTWANIKATLLAFFDTKYNPINIIVSGNITAENNKYYFNVASATYTDPTPAEGVNFEVMVVAGTATVGGVGYSVVGTSIKRIYNSGAWISFPSTNQNTYTTWVPTFTGFSVDPTGFTARYSLGLDKTCDFSYQGSTQGTSNATTFTITLPFVANTTRIIRGLIRNSGSIADGTMRTRAGSNIADVYVSPLGTFASSGGKDMFLSGTYEIQ